MQAKNYISLALKNQMYIIKMFVKMSNKEGIKGSVRNFVLESTFNEKDKIKDNTLLFQEGFFDSMGFVSLISFLEEEFNVKTNDEDLIEENFESIDAITEFIFKNKN